MDFSDEQNQVRVLLGEETATFYTDQEIKDQLNRSRKSIAARLQIALQTSCAYTTTSGTDRYALPDDFMRQYHALLQITTDDRRELLYLTPEQFHRRRWGRATQTGVPKVYTVERGAVAVDDGTQLPGDIWLFPVPDDNGGSDYTLRLRYYQTPSDLTNDTDISEFPQYMELIPCYHAAFSLSIKAKDRERTNTLKALFNEEIAVAERMLARDQQDRMYVVGDEMGYSDLDFDEFGLYD